MTERLTTLSLNQIRIHPDNPRLDAAASTELVESVRLHGLIDPPLVAPAAESDEVLLLDGHRRFDAARQAGLTEIPVRVRDDLVTTAQQIEVMAITGLQKELLSSVEEARAYEQLTLLGMDEKAIATATGYSRARVKQRLKLAGLNQGIQTAVHTGQATLLEVEALFEFADDIEATKELEEVLGTNEFAYKVNELRSRRKRAARNAEIIAGFEDLGAVKIDTERDTFTTLWRWRGSDLAEPAAHTHAECLGYVDTGAASYAEPYLACLDPDSHPTPDAPGIAGKSDEEREADRVAWEQQQAERTAERERQAAASTARQEWLVEHFTALFPAKGNSQLAASLAGLLPAAFADQRLDDLVTDRALDIVGGEKPAERSWEAERAATYAAALDLTTAKPPAILAALGRFLGIWAAELLDQSYVDDDELPTVLWLWDWLAGSGYPMSSVDTERHQQFAARAAEQDDDTDAGGDQ